MHYHSLDDDDDRPAINFSDVALSACLAGMVGFPWPLLLIALHAFTM
jgi:hypothetical protein